MVHVGRHAGLGSVTGMAVQIIASAWGVQSKLPSELAVLSMHMTCCLGAQLTKPEQCGMKLARRH